MNSAIQLHNDPLIYVIDDFLTKEQCDHIISISKPSLKRSTVSSDGDGVISEARTSLNTWIKHDTDNITKTISNKICNLVNIEHERSENFQVIHYDVSQEYRPHYDGWDHDYTINKNLKHLKRGGQRLFTALCYLNDVEEGGGTSFPKLNIEISPKMGKLLVFQNVYRNTNIKHDGSLHTGMPVIKGEKYAFNLWFREIEINKVPGYIISYESEIRGLTNLYY